jgi:hypothetical protein
VCWLLLLAVYGAFLAQGTAAAGATQNQAGRLRILFALKHPIDATR